jgi:hypothetical protein
VEQCQLHRAVQRQVACPVPAIAGGFTGCYQLGSIFVAFWRLLLFFEDTLPYDIAVGGNIDRDGVADLGIELHELEAL